MMFYMKAEKSKIKFLDLNNRKEVKQWCDKFNCSEEVLRYCVANVGYSLISIEAFLCMNSDWIHMKLNNGDKYTKN